MSVTVGSGTSGAGGSMSVLAGRSTVNTGGCRGHRGRRGHRDVEWRLVAIRTANAGVAGLAGMLVLSSGSSSKGGTGSTSDWLWRGDGRHGRRCHDQRWQRHVRRGRRRLVVWRVAARCTRAARSCSMAAKARRRAVARHDSQRERGHRWRERHAGVQHGHVKHWQHWCDLHRHWRGDGRTGGLVTVIVGSGTSGAGGRVPRVGWPQHREHGRCCCALRRAKARRRAAARSLIRSANAGATGVSGVLVFSSGTSSKGNSGALLIGSGAATGGKGGSRVGHGGQRHERCGRLDDGVWPAAARCTRAASVSLRAARAPRRRVAAGPSVPRTRARRG